jgi:hypothetical protein
MTSGFPTQVRDLFYKEGHCKHTESLRPKLKNMQASLRSNQVIYDCEQQLLLIQEFG